MNASKFKPWTIASHAEGMGLAISHADRPGRIDVLIAGGNFSVAIKGAEGQDIAKVSIGCEEAQSSPWNPSTSEDGRYLLVDLDAKRQLHIKAEDEGFVIDAWNAEQSDTLDGICALFAELEAELD